MKRIKDTNDEYHSHKSISASGLKTIYKKSVYHHLNSVFKMTDAMNFGSAVHSALLEDSNDIAVLPEFNARTKEGKKIKQDFFDNNKGKIIIKQEEQEAIEKIKKNFNGHSLAKSLVQRLTETEVSYYGTIDKVPVRVRPDGIKDNDYIIDIKTTSDASPRFFKSQVYNFAYHLQACFYSEALGYDPAKFRFITIENKYPYTVEVFAMSEDMIEYGRDAWRIAFNSWKEYLETNNVGSFYWEQFNKDGSLIL
jgi:hypothetical protein|tara:strand:+ start:54 stop:809 length:756 start_codon:yes stop_codon:yes gene_type:complete